MNARLKEVPQPEPRSVFEVLSAVDCSAHVEHKGKFAYLSWPYAVGELLKHYPAATWRVIETPTGSPCWLDESGAFVKAAVTVEGIERVQIHPVLNSNNKPIAKPNAFEVNTSIQRATVKAMALHGLGLYIYAGEDLPEAAQAENDAKVEAEREAAGKEEAADVAAWIETIDATDTLDALNELGKGIAAAKLSGAAKVKLRAAFAARKHAFEAKA